MRRLRSCEVKAYAADRVSAERGGVCAVVRRFPDGKERCLWVFFSERPEGAEKVCVSVRKDVRAVRLLREQVPERAWACRDEQKCRAEVPAEQAL